MRVPLVYNKWPEWISLAATFALFALAVATMSLASCTALHRESWPEDPAKGVHRYLDETCYGEAYVK